LWWREITLLLSYAAWPRQKEEKVHCISNDEAKQSLKQHTANCLLLCFPPPA
jgi:hypothetical protein